MDEMMYEHHDDSQDIEADVREYDRWKQDTESDNALQQVQAMVSQVAREQGGTEFTAIDHSKGTADGFPRDENESVNSDPQGFSWNDRPRKDSADYEDPYGMAMVKSMRPSPRHMI